MNVIRLLIIAFLTWLAYRFIRSLLRPPTPSSQAGGTTRAVATMVRCEHCGLHVPDTEAVRDGNHVYCSARHRNQHHT